MHRLLVAILLFLCTVLMTACGTIAEAGASVHTLAAVDTAKIERGIEVYRANYCGACHTLDAANTRGTFGPDHNQAHALAITNLSLDTYTGDAATVEDYLHESIVAPTVFYTPGYEATNHHMPAFGHLPDDDIAALVYLLAQQR